MDSDEFWRRIEDYLIENNISWNELSRRSGISRQNLLKNRRMRTEPRLTTIVRIMDAAKIDAKDLFF